MAIASKKTLNDIRAVPYFLLNFPPAAIETNPRSKIAVVRIVKRIIYNIIYFELIHSKLMINIVLHFLYLYEIIFLTATMLG